MGTLKIWDHFINHMTIILRVLISILNIYKALKYIILNTLEIDCPPSTQKSRFFVMWTKNVKFQHTFNILGVHQYM
jgi:hypothetical protein